MPDLDHLSSETLLLEAARNVVMAMRLLRMDGQHVGPLSDAAHCLSVLLERMNHADDADQPIFSDSAPN